MPAFRSFIANAATGDEQPLQVFEITYAATPISVQILHFREQKKETGWFRKMRFLYEIETCVQATGDV